MKSVDHPIAPCKGIQTSLIFYIPRRGFRILCQLTLVPGFQIPWAVFRIPKPRIPRISQAKLSLVSDSTSKAFPDSGIRIPLHGAKRSLKVGLRARVWRKLKGGASSASRPARSPSEKNWSEEWGGERFRLIANPIQ